MYPFWFTQAEVHALLNVLSASGYITKSTDIFGSHNLIGKRYVSFLVHPS